MKVKKILFTIFSVITFLFFAFHLFNELYFLRQPIRNIPDDNSVFVSPANWKIIKIIHQDELTDWNTKLYKNNNVVIDNWTEWFSWATLVSIMMTPLDAHFQKAPLYSKLINQYYYPGHFYNATKSNDIMSSTFQNEYNSMLYLTPEWYQFRIIQIAGFMAWRIVSLLEPNDIVEQWQFIWAIKLWSQVSVVLDDNFEVLAKEWDIVIDWETIIAKKKDITSGIATFNNGNITRNPDIKLDIENSIRYWLFEIIHPNYIINFFWIIILIVQILAWMKILSENKLWKYWVLIPIYNIYLAFKLAWKPIRTWSILLYPILFLWLPLLTTNIYRYILLLLICLIPRFVAQFLIAKKYWKNKWFSIWLCLCPFVFYPYLAWIKK